MKEVTDALLIMVLVLKSVMSSLLYNVSTIIYFMMHGDLEWTMVSASSKSSETYQMKSVSSDDHLFFR